MGRRGPFLLSRVPPEISFSLRPRIAVGIGAGAVVHDAPIRRPGEAPLGLHVVALDDGGESWTTLKLAQALRAWRDRGLAVAFVIGSADGLSEDIKRNADVIVSLSALTLPHGLVRVLLAEQLYRAISLLQGHPYHRE